MCSACTQLSEFLFCVAIYLFSRAIVLRAAIRSHALCSFGFKLADRYYVGTQAGLLIILEALNKPSLGVSKSLQTGLSGFQKSELSFVTNPRRACARGLHVVVLYVCVSVSVFSILAFRAFRHPTRGISGYSTENAVKLKSRFL